MGGLVVGLAIGSALQSWLRVDIVPIGVSNYHLCMLSIDTSCGTAGLCPWLDHTCGQHT